MNHVTPALPARGQPIRYRCTACADSGVIMARAKDTQARGVGYYAFKCDCSAGRFDARRYPSWIGNLENYVRIG